MRRLMVVAWIAGVASVGLCAVASPSSATRGTTAGFAPVKTLRGAGATVVTTQLPTGPLVFSVAHRGKSTFTVEIRGPAGRDLLVNEVGVYTGQAIAETRFGRHRVIVKADGAWTIQVLRPTKTDVRVLPGFFAGNVPTVFSVRSSQARELVLTTSNVGDGDFVVSLYGYAGLTCRDLLVNEIGPWKGQLPADVPQGYMLLSVHATGRWLVKFAP